MQFNPYERMWTNLSKLEISQQMEEKEKWVVIEKIHGANLSFHVSEDHVKVARRRDFLEQDESFFNFRDAEFMKTYPDKMKKVFEDAVKRFPDKEIKHVTVWGEIFGGIYEFDGKRRRLEGDGNIAQCVQYEVLYTPNIEWVAYDISYRKTNDQENQEYLDYDVAIEMFETHGIFHLKPLLIGKMKEALNYDLRFDSTLPKILGFPALSKGSNIVEGVVVKPFKNSYRPNRFRAEKRAIVKLKNPEFTEVHKAPPKDAKPPKLFNKIMEYATEARLTNAISKHGAPTEDEVAKRIVKEFVDDIFVDITADDETLDQEWSNAAESEKAKIKNKLASKAYGFIKKMIRGR